MFQGQGIVSFFVLAIMIIYIASNRKHMKQLDILLCAYAMLSGALIVESIADIFGDYADSSMNAILLAFQMLLTGMAFLLHLYFDLIAGRHKSDASFFFLNVGFFLPIVLAVVYWIADGNVSMISSSVVVSFLFYFIFERPRLKDRQMRDAEDYHEDDDESRNSMLFGADSEQTDRTYENADTLMLGRPISFRWEMENIEHFLALNNQDPQNEIEVIFDLQETDFYIPPLLIRRMVEIIIRLRNEELKDGQPVFVTTERQGENIRVCIENEFPETNQDVNPKEIDWIGKVLKEENNRLQVQCGGYLSKTDGPNGIRIVILMPVPVPKNAPAPPSKMEALAPQPMMKASVLPPVMETVAPMPKMEVSVSSPNTETPVPSPKTETTANYVRIVDLDSEPDEAASEEK